MEHTQTQKKLKLKLKNNKEAWIHILTLQWYVLLIITAPVLQAIYA